MTERLREFELAVGDMVQIGEHIVTVVDIDGPEVSFRIDPSDSGDVDLEFCNRRFPASK